MESWNNYHKKLKSQDWINKPSIFAKQMFSHLPESGSILELGAGQGQDSRFFLYRGFNIVSTDINEIALEISKSLLYENQDQIEFKVVDTGKPLPFDDESFDAVYSHLGLHYFSESKTREVFAEIHRVLRTNGVLVSLFNTTEDPEIQNPAFEKLEEHYYIEVPKKLHKAYFSTDYVRNLSDGFFETVILDNHGESYKDKIKTLVRFVGKKI